MIIRKQSNPSLKYKPLIALFLTVVSLICLIIVSLQNQAIVVKKTTISSIFEILAESVHCETVGLSAPPTQSDPDCSMSKQMELNVFTVKSGIGKLKKILSKKQISTSSTSSTSTTATIHFSSRKLMVEYGGINSDYEYFKFPIQGVTFFQISQTWCLIIAQILLEFATLFFIISAIKSSRRWYRIGNTFAGLAQTTICIVVIGATSVFAGNDDCYLDHYNTLSDISSIVYVYYNVLINI